MALYRYADLTVSCAPCLAGCALAGHGRAVAPVVECRLLTEQPLEPAAGDWLHHWRSQTDVSELCLARGAAGFLLRFPDLADFVIDVEKGRIGAWLAPGGSMETLRHLLLDQVLPRLAAHRGRMVLHAGAVHVGDQAIAFVGASGLGKSTLAGSFHTAGYPALTDDSLLLIPGEDTVLVQPTYPSLRLWPDALASLFVEPPETAPVAHYSDKQSVIMANGAATACRPLPLAALYVLSPPKTRDALEVSLTELSSRDACMAIVGNSFQLDVADKRRAAGFFSLAGTIAQKVPTYSLSYPRDFARLPLVRAAILQSVDDRMRGGTESNSNVAGHDKVEYRQHHAFVMRT